MTVQYVSSFPNLKLNEANNVYFQDFNYYDDPNVNRPIDDVQDQTQLGEILNFHRLLKAFAHDILLEMNQLIDDSV